MRANRVGLRWVFDLRDNLQRELFFLGEYEPDLGHLLLAEVSENDVFVDVGANIGSHALPVARHLTKLGGGTVFAFEPAFDTAQRLQSLIDQNHIKDVEIVPLALGNETATATLHAARQWKPQDLGVRSLVGSGSEVQTVSVVRFDDWARTTGLARLDIVKIDVEGFEMRALEGMQLSLTRLRPKLVVVEVVEELLKNAGASPPDISRFFSSIGYRPIRCTPEDATEGVCCALWPNVAFRPVDSSA